MKFILFFTTLHIYITSATTDSALNPKVNVAASFPRQSRSSSKNKSLFLNCRLSTNNTITIELDKINSTTTVQQCRDLLLPTTTKGKQKQQPSKPLKPNLTLQLINQVQKNQNYSLSKHVLSKITSSNDNIKALVFNHSLLESVDFGELFDKFPNVTKIELNDNSLTRIIPPSSFPNRTVNLNLKNSLHCSPDLIKNTTTLCTKRINCELSGFNFLNCLTANQAYWLPSGSLNLKPKKKVGVKLVGYSSTVLDVEQVLDGLDFKIDDNEGVLVGNYSSACQKFIERKFQLKGGAREIVILSACLISKDDFILLNLQLAGIDTTSQRIDFKLSFFTSKNSTTTTTLQLRPLPTLKIQIVTRRTDFLIFIVVFNFLVIGFGLLFCIIKWWDIPCFKNLNNNNQHQQPTKKDRAIVVNILKPTTDHPPPPPTNDDVTEYETTSLSTNVTVNPNQNNTLTPNNQRRPRPTQLPISSKSQIAVKPLSTIMSDAPGELEAEEISKLLLGADETGLETIADHSPMKKSFTETDV